MALFKQIELDNGVVINYHRISGINKITNNCTILEISGYTNQNKRNEEIIGLRTGETINVYIDSTVISIDYDEDRTIKDYYTYLKTTEKYNGAIDV